MSNPDLLILSIKFYGKKDEIVTAKMIRKIRIYKKKIRIYKNYTESLQLLNRENLQNGYIRETAIGSVKNWLTLGKLKIINNASFNN
jgi:hypothetical protein